MVIGALALDDRRGAAVDIGGSFSNVKQCWNPFRANKNIA
jgi:hypothetical protein